MAQTAKSISAREASLERRRALTTMGKAALTGGTVASTSQTNKITTVVVNTPAQVSSLTGRSASRARRDAMSSSGKTGLAVKDRIRSAPAINAASAASQTTQQNASVEDKSSADCGCGCGCGCNGTKATCGEKPGDLKAVNKSRIIPNKKRQAVTRSDARIASLARREATSTRGKAGINANGFSAAQTARAANPGISSRELAKALRESRSNKGKSGQKKAEPNGRMSRRMRSNKSANGAAKDAPWKVGESETVQGQTLTGTMVGRSQSVTGDEASTCRDVTGTEYMGADVFREFCQADATPATARKVNVTTTSHGNAVSGDRVGRGKNVTGNEAGTCKSVTGDEYISAEQSQAYCGEFAKKSPRKFSMAETMKGESVTGNNVGRSEKMTGDESGMSRTLTGTQYTKPEEIGNSPAKVGVSTTLRGGSVTGTTVGRRERMTGDEAGSCRNVTGDDYVGQEQYNGFCSATAEAPTDRKVGVSTTGKGLSVTGTMTGRSDQVTGNEPGSCKAVTGTPYGGADQSENFCQAEDVALASRRNRELRSTPAMPLTGIQPGVGGVMTGADKGACEQVSGTPYIGADQFADVCPATPATSASPDFPQAIDGNTVGQQFSVNTPSGGAAAATGSTGVTGKQNAQSHITGPFGMATGKVTGTEDSRFGKGNVNAVEMRPEPVAQVEGREKTRISGEGQDTGLNITGDDWGRGKNVTGTEGMSSIKRNPTIRANNSMDAMKEMAAIAQKRNEEIAIPNSKVTGGSGNTDKGSLITYSGGARG
ncbi:MAG: CsoS2 family carboxysome shell protein [Gammaproteobacteria bacterium]|nr:CsoS2 family carboxysome shell protein [Gammaproteobacteria bacterium]